MFKKIIAGVALGAALVMGDRLQILVRQRLWMYMQENKQNLI